MGLSNILANSGHKLMLQLNPEFAHQLGAELMKSRLFAPGKFVDEKEYEIFGVKLDNPLGLAAGFDKTGELIECSSDYGFGFIEAGSFTYRGGPGNPEPRLFRLR